MKRLIPALAICAALMLPAPRSRADSTDHKTWNFISNTGSILYLALGIGLPLAEDGKAGQTRAVRSADSVLSAVLLSEGLKSITREQRPDKSDNDSFPSGHATAAFAVATMEAQYHPKQAIWWFAGAGLIGASRVALHRHYIHDVIAGAALGFGTARWELASRRGLVLYPFISPSGHGGGLAIAGRF